MLARPVEPGILFQKIREWCTAEREVSEMAPEKVHCTQKVSEIFQIADLETLQGLNFGLTWLPGAPRDGKTQVVDVLLEQVTLGEFDSELVLLDNSQKLMEQEEVFFDGAGADSNIVEERPQKTLPFHQKLRHLGVFPHFSQHLLHHLLKNGWG